MDKSDEILDSWLVEKYQFGHKSALTLLVKRWHGKFCKQAYWYTNDFDVAKDIAQDSWKIIINKFDSLNDSTKFGGWALLIVKRQSIDYIRKVKKTKENLYNYEQIIKSSGSLIETDNTDIIYVILKTIKVLPENQQLILRLFYLESNSLIQISEILKISKGTVKSRLYYAREKLKTILKDKYYE